MAGVVARGGRQVGVDMTDAGMRGGASGWPARAAAEKDTGGRGPGASGGLSAPVACEEPTARTAPGWVSRQSAGASAGGAAQRIPGAPAGPSSAGLPGTVSGRGRGPGRAPAPPSATATTGSPRGPGPAPGVFAAPGMLDGVRRRLAESGAEPTPARVAQALREQGRVLGDAEILGAAEQLRSELVGSGPLEPLLADPSVTDVLVSAPDRVWVDRGGGLELTPVVFPDAAAVRRLAQRLATVAGRRLDDARPWVDARLPDGTRLHAVLPPVA
ncbi:ATPase, T2SS/T4P/T4SS family, partial [Streptomyces ardesiacus]|uniref:ATPase, T2SS/T4P/T4SS family n=1 Tax=Streptomyces ardesiacus TaxID=285564 RepID=UPI00365961B9